MFTRFTYKMFIIMNIFLYKMFNILNILFIFAAINLV